MRVAAHTATYYKSTSPSPLLCASTSPRTRQGSQRCAKSRNKRHALQKILAARRRDREWKARCRSRPFTQRRCMCCPKEVTMQRSTEEELRLILCDVITRAARPKTAAPPSHIDIHTRFPSAATAVKSPTCNPRKPPNRQQANPQNIGCASPRSVVEGCREKVKTSLIRSNDERAEKRVASQRDDAATIDNKKRDRYCETSPGALPDSKRRPRLPT